MWFFIFILLIVLLLAKTGGRDKIWDIEKTTLTGPVQDRLVYLHKTFGSKILLKYKKDKLAVRLEHRQTPSGLKYYTLFYDTPRRDTELMPFKINFIHPYTAEKSDVSYIDSINKTIKYSGSTLVRLCIEINRALGVSKILLSDGAQINCGDISMDLSFIKLIEKGATFYQSLGFDFEMPDTSVYFMYQFPDLKSLHAEIDTLIDNIRKITVAELIEENKRILDLCHHAIRDNKPYKFTKKIYGTFFNITEIWREPNIVEIMHRAAQNISILSGLGTKYLYQGLVWAFKNHIELYHVLSKDIVMDTTSELSYGGETIRRDYVLHFSKLIKYKNSLNYSYIFKKKNS